MKGIENALPHRIRLLKLNWHCISNHHTDFFADILQTWQKKLCNTRNYTTKKEVKGYILWYLTKKDILVSDSQFVNFSTKDKISQFCPDFVKKLLCPISIQILSAWNVICNISQGLLKLLWMVYSMEKLQSCLKSRNFQTPFNTDMSVGL